MTELTRQRSGRQTQSGDNQCSPTCTVAWAVLQSEHNELQLSFVYIQHSAMYGEQQRFCTWTSLWGHYCHIFSHSLSDCLLYCILEYYMTL